MLYRFLLLWLGLLAMAVLALYLARQTRALHRANADLREAQQRLTALHQIALSLSTTLDVGKLLETILAQLGQLWGYDHGDILLVDEVTGDLVVAASRGNMNGPGHRLPADQGICSMVARTGAPLFVRDVTADPRYVPGLQGARSELAVPLVWEGRILGVLNVESDKPNAYGQADLDLLTTVAEQAAAAIGNARLHQQTRNLAITDPHTGLYNYRYFQEQMAAMVRDAQLSGGTCSLLMMDVDHFKKVNDTYGHPTGDALLQQVARALRECCRQEDLLFRYAGDEFAILLPEATSEVALRVAERVRDRVASYSFSTRSGRRLDFGITVSLGVATYPRDGLTPVDLVLAADTALYAAKGAGRNRVVVAGQGSGGGHLQPA